MESDLSHPLPRVINIEGKTPNGDILLQSVDPLSALKKSLAIYLARSLKAADTLDIQAIQDIFSAQAQDIEELSALTFEPNQRVGELIALVSIVAAINQLNSTSHIQDAVFSPAWQKPNQGTVIKSFTNKESWDGFVYELPPEGSSETAPRVAVVPVEIKSLMIDPVYEHFVDLNDLLKTRMPKFSKHFQAEGSIGAVLVLPYQNTKDSAVAFDLKNATLDINNHVNHDSVSVLVFFDINHEGDETFVSTKTHFVRRNPALRDNDAVKDATLYELKWSKY